MGRKRVGPTALVAFSALLLGSAAARAGHPVMAPAPVFLRLGDVQRSGVGFELGAKDAPPVGSHLLITIPLLNRNAEFDKPVGAQVGQLAIDCTVLTKTRAGACSGVTTLPGGYFTFRVPDRALRFGTRFDHVTLRTLNAPILGGIGNFACKDAALYVNSPADVRVVMC
jgi:hypothetical protein